MGLAQSCSSQDRACEKRWIQTSLRESGLGGLGVGPGQFSFSLSAVTSQDDAGSNLRFWSLSCREVFSP